LTCLWLAHWLKNWLVYWLAYWATDGLVGYLVHTRWLACAVLGNGTFSTLLATLSQILGDSAELCKTRLSLFDVVDHTLQRSGMFINDRIDDVPKIPRKSVTTFVRRHALRMMPTMS
jgi:hypothetical protein